MENESDILGRDDWALTLKELKGQRVQLLLQLEVVNAGIARCALKVLEFPAIVEADIDGAE